MLIEDGTTGYDPRVMFWTRGPICLVQHKLVYFILLCYEGLLGGERGGGGVGGRIGGEGGGGRVHNTLYNNGV
jgi:hypothetical protein